MNFIFHDNETYDIFVKFHLGFRAGMLPRGKIDKFLRLLPVAVALFSIKTLMKMPNGAEKKCQATVNGLRNEFLENIPGLEPTNHILVLMKLNMQMVKTFKKGE